MSWNLKMSWKCPGISRCPGKVLENRVCDLRALFKHVATTIICIKLLYFNWYIFVKQFLLGKQDQIVVSGFGDPAQ